MKCNTQSGFSLLGGALLGAAAMYLLDPESGRRRRSNVSSLAEDALERAQKKFLQLGMQKTQERNGVLIFVAPRAQKFAVIGDEGVHQRCGERFWQELIDKMRVHFQREDFT